jgi:hypothetical protein
MSQERFDKLEQSLDRIEKALVGDKAMGNLGIVDRLHEVERITARHGKIITWVTMAWTVLVGIMIYFKHHIAESIVNRIN